MVSPLYDRITAISESGNRDFDRNGRPIRSRAGAMYRMQTMPATARSPGFGVRPAVDSSPEEFNRVGREYRDAMFNRYGDPAKGWAAYNWGPGNMDKALARYGDDWLKHAPAETQAYVKKNVGALGGAVPKKQTLANVAKGPMPALASPTGITLGDLVAPDMQPFDLGLTVPQKTPEQKPKFLGKGGIGTGLLAGLADGLTMWASAGRDGGHAVQGLQQMAQNDQEMEFNREKWAQELEQRKQLAMAKAQEPYRFQNNSGDVVQLDPTTGNTQVLYADPYQKPNWMRVENSDGSVTLQPGPGGVRPSQSHIDALVQNPSMAADFDAKFGRGMANYILGGR